MGASSGKQATADASREVFPGSPVAPRRPAAGVGRRGSVYAAELKRSVHRRNVASLDPSREMYLIHAYGSAAPSTIYCRNPLCDAAALCDEKAVMHILCKGIVDVNALSEEGESALHIATRRGHVPLVEVLLNAGARVNATDRHGFTPLHHAVQCDLRQARQLLDAHFPPRANSAASSICIAPNNEALMQVLLNHGADPCIASHDGTTPLFLALRLRNLTETIFFLKLPEMQRCGSHTAANGETVFHLLAGLGVVNILDAVLKGELFAFRRKKPLITSAVAKHTRLLQSAASSMCMETLAEVLQRIRQSSECNDGVGGVAHVSTFAEFAPTAVPMVLLDCWEEESAVLRTAWVTLSSEASAASGAALPAHSNRAAKPALLFPVPKASRQRPTIAMLVGSDTFRHQGHLPLEIDESDSVSLWCAGRVIDEERSYWVEVSRVLRRQAGQVLTSLLPKQARRGGNKGPPEESKAPPSSLLTFDLLIDFFDVCERDGCRPVAMLDTNNRKKNRSGGASPGSAPAAGIGSPADDADEKPETPPRTSPTGSPPATPIQRSPVSPASNGRHSATSLCSGGIDRQPTATDRLPGLSLREKMDLLFGAGAVQVPVLRNSEKARQRSQPSASVETVGTVTASDATGEAVEQLLYRVFDVDEESESAAQQVGYELHPLDQVVVSGPNAGKSPLAYCNDHEGKTYPLQYSALNEKRCILMLLSLRAQLLCENSFGIPATHA